MSAAASIRRASRERLLLLYSDPAGNSPDLERRVRDCVARHGELVAIDCDQPEMLARRTRFAVFVSATLPTLVLVRDDVVVYEAIGAVPSSELRRAVAMHLAR